MAVFCEEQELIVILQSSLTLMWFLSVSSRGLQQFQGEFEVCTELNFLCNKNMNDRKRKALQRKGSKTLLLGFEKTEGAHTLYTPVPDVCISNHV